MIPTAHTKGKLARDPCLRYARLLKHHEQIESELSRAMNRWQKSKERLKRAEKRCDRWVLSQQQTETIEWT